MSNTRYCFFVFFIVLRNIFFNSGKRLYSAILTFNARMHERDDSLKGVGWFGEDSISYTIINIMGVAIDSRGY